MRLVEALDIKQGEVISLIGAGGKSTVLWLLADELLHNVKRVVVTTTTKIYWPEDFEVFFLHEKFDRDKLYDIIINRKLVVIGKGKKGNKLVGIDSQDVEWLKKYTGSTVLVEADGAAGKSFKAPLSYEPVVPDCTSLVIPVVGADILGKRLTSENAHRLDKVMEITGLKEGDVIDACSVGKVLLSKKGYCRSDIIPVKGRWIPLINKLDLCRTKIELQKLIDLLLESEGPAQKVIGSTLIKQKSIWIWSSLKRGQNKC